MKPNGRRFPKMTHPKKTELCKDCVDLARTPDFVEAWAARRKMSPAEFKRAYHADNHSLWSARADQSR
jgi:hypothetical protein